MIFELHKRSEKEYKSNRGNFPKYPMSIVVMDKILRFISIYYGVDYGELKSKNKSTEISNARHVFFYVVKDIKPDTALQTIGRFIGRHHTTVIYGINTFQGLLDTYADALADYVEFKEALKKHLGSDYIESIAINRL
jgi:chromosomal replication initiation ATPase DnaA